MPSHGGFHLARLPGYLILSLEHDLVCSFDAEGRLFHAFLDTTTYRLGLGGKAVTVRAPGPETNPASVALDSGEKAAVFGKVREIVGSLLAGGDDFQTLNDFSVTGEEARDELKKISRALEPDAMARQWKRFRSVYGSVPILPPDCYGALLVQLTTGCSYGECAFCSLYGDRRFRIREDGELAAHVEEVVDFQGRALPRWKSVFLGDANALIVPQKDLARRIGVLRNIAEERGAGRAAGELHAFTDAGPPVRSLGEWVELHELGLKRVHIGLETGDWELRERLQKSGSPTVLKAKISNLKEGGVAVGLILLAGIGGREAARAHVDETVRQLAEYPLDAEDIIYISPLRPELVHGPDWSAATGPDPLSEDEIWEQAYELMDELKSALRGKGFKIAFYDIRRFVY